MDDELGNFVIGKLIDRFIGELNVRDDEEEFEDKFFKDIYPEELQLNKNIWITWWRHFWIYKLKLNMKNLL